jgi:hypothetical protein
MSNFVNLNDVGGLSTAGRAYGADADTGASEARTFEGRMAASHQGLRGRAGMSFTGMTGTHSANLQLLGQRFAEQAVRAVRGEQTIVSSDDESFTAQQATATTVDGQTSLMSRTINV